jgi:hypothetical protein
LSKRIHRLDVDREIAARSHSNADAGNQRLGRSRRLSLLSRIVDEIRRSQENVGVLAGSQSFGDPWSGILLDSYDVSRFRLEALCNLAESGLDRANAQDFYIRGRSCQA